MASNFDNFLADFSKSGNRFNLLPRLTASGKASGMTADEIVERVRAVGVTNRDADIRRLFNGSKVEPNRHSASCRPPRRSRPAEPPAEPLKQEDRDFVPVTLRNYCRTTAFTGTATADILAETIRMSDADLRLDDHAYRLQAARQLRAIFCPGEMLWAGWIDANGKRAFDGRPLSSGGGIVTAHDLADRIEAGRLARIPTHVSLQPVTGKPDANGSFDSGSTIAAFRHVLVEWDNLFDLGGDGVKTPSQAHVETVAGLLDYSFETDRIRPLVAVCTGGKSIHVALRMKADGPDAYKRQTDALRDLFASADDAAFRADPSGWGGYTHIRLAGAIRPETGRRARLLWCNS